MKYNLAAVSFLRHMAQNGSSTAHALTVAAADDNLLRRYGSQFRSDKSKQLTGPELTRLRTLVNSLAGTRGGFEQSSTARKHRHVRPLPMPGDPNAAFQPVDASVVAGAKNWGWVTRYQSTMVQSALQQGTRVYTKAEINNMIRAGQLRLTTNSSGQVQIG